MNRIIYDVPRWHLYLHREARALPRAAPDDNPMFRFEDELFERLFSGAMDLLPADKQDGASRDWAQRLHSTCEQFPSFTRLAEQCHGDATAAAIAVEELLRELKPALPEAPTVPPADALRRPLSRACDKAADAVDMLQDVKSGLEHVSFATGGAQPGTGASPDNAGAASLVRRLRNDERLRQIALLAGRFKRILASKRRERTRSGAEEVANIEQGADLARLVPNELARFSHPLQRLAFLRDFTERRCLQYEVIANETLGKGPLVVCLDKSGSMSGKPDIWSTAVALALLDVAHDERRPFALLGFDANIRYRVTVGVGEPLPKDALCVPCDGGTNIALAMSTGLDIISERPGKLRKADIVLITDGQSDPSTASDLRKRALALGVSILGFGIGVPLTALAPWCDTAVAVESLDKLDGKTADTLASV